MYLENIKKILIIRFSSLGDIVLTTPIIKVLKKKYPRSKIFYVTKSEYFEIVKLFPDIDSIFCLNSREKFKGFIELIKRINLEKFDLLIDLHRSLRSIILYLFSFAKYKACYSKHRFLRFLRVFFKWKLLPENLHVVDYYFEPLKRFGVSKNGEEELELNISEDMQEQVKECLKKFGVKDNDLLIGICPGAKWRTKRWPVDKFAKLGDKLINDLSAKVILMGDLNDLLIGEEIERLMSKTPINLIGKTSLVELVTLIKKCNLIITNDSSPLHISVSVKTPSISIFGPTTLDFGFGPYGQGHIVIEKDLPCRPCSAHGNHRCVKKTHKCMKLINPIEIFKTVKILLKKDENFLKKV